MAPTGNLGQNISKYWQKKRNTTHPLDFLQSSLSSLLTATGQNHSGSSFSQIYSRRLPNARVAAWRWRHNVCGRYEPIPPPRLHNPLLFKSYKQLLGFNVFHSKFLVKSWNRGDEMYSILFTLLGLSNSSKTMGHIIASKWRLDLKHV